VAYRSEKLAVEGEVSEAEHKRLLAFLDAVFGSTKPRI